MARIILLSFFCKQIVILAIYIEKNITLTEYLIMQDEQWQELDFSDFDDDVEFEKKKSKKQNKRKWREIEDYKEQQREKRELDFSENYYSF